MDIMDDFDILKEMLIDTATVPLLNNKVQLSEEIKKDEKYSVIIFNIPTESMVIKIDHFPAPKSIFSGSKGECRRADYAIISTEKKVIVFIELKKTKSLKEDIIKQLMGAQCVMVYCREMGKVFWKKHDFLDGYEYRFVSIGQIGIAKRPTRSKKHDKHDTPEKMMKITSPHRLEFNHLV
jgi:hypothetical protein